MAIRGSVYSIYSVVVLLGASFQAEARPQVLAISGGGDALQNHCRYYDNLERVRDGFSADWDLSVIADDGPSTSAPNVSVCEREPNGSIAVQQLRDAEGRPLVRTATSDPAPVAAARLEEIKVQLRARIRHLEPGEPLMLYFTDHGGNGSDGATVELWGETLSVSELRDLINLVPEGNPVIQIHDQCYGGGMLDSIWTPDAASGHPRPRSCGFAAAHPGELAYGGGGFMSTLQSGFAEAGVAGFGLDDVHQRLRNRSDLGSTPVASSDLLLRRYLERVRESDPAVHIVGSRSAIRRDCATFEGGAFAPILREIGVPLSPLITGPLHAIRLDLNHQYAMAGIPPDEVSLEDLEQRIESNRALAAEHERIGTEMRPQLNQAIEDWMRADPATRGLVERMEGLYRSLRRAGDRLLAEPDNAGFKRAVDDIQSRYREAQREHDRWWNAATEGTNVVFHEFLAGSGTRYLPDNAAELRTRYKLGAHANVSELFLAARSARNTTLTTNTDYRRLHVTLTNYNALKLMAERNDAHARETLLQYLDMRQCESTMPSGGNWGST